MQIERTLHSDRIPADPNEPIIERYDYELLRFSDGGAAFRVRRYASEIEEASFLGAELGGARRLMTKADLQSALFRAAVAYLKENGVTRVQWLNPDGEGYELVTELA